MKIIDIINKIYKKEKLPNIIEYLDVRFYYESNYGGYYTELGINMFNYLIPEALGDEVIIIEQ